MTDMDLLRENGTLRAQNARLMRMVADLSERLDLEMSPRVGVSGQVPEQSRPSLALVASTPQSEPKP